MKDLDAFLDVLNDNVEPKKDMIILEGMVADSLEVASPYENVHDKLLIDATTIPTPDLGLILNLSLVRSKKRL